MTTARDADRVSPTRHVPYIDGLRAIAVLAVIVYHLRETWLPGGFAGVDIFFAISGFVVATSVGGWNKGGFAAFLGYFYARRLQRIAPALMVCLLVTGLASALFIPPSWLSQANETTGSYAFFGLSNWYLAFHRENYFSPTIDFNPYTHTWSLGVEEQFYLLFPPLFFLWTRGGRWRGICAALFAIAFVASLLWAARLGRSDATAAFYLITTRLFELAAGVLLYQWLARKGDSGTRPASRSAAIGAWFALAAIGYALATANPRTFPYPGALLPIAGTIALLGCLHGRGGVLQRALGGPAITYVGRISYSLYLWHWPVFVLMRWTCGLDSPATRVAGVALTFALAALSYRFVERPLRYSPRLRQWHRAAVVTAGAAAIAACWWLAAVAVDHRAALSASVVTRHRDDWYPSPVQSLDEAPGCRLSTQPGSAGPNPFALFSRTGCPAPASPAPTIFVIGDSHAPALTGMLTAHVLRSGASVVLYYHPGCTFASLQPEREGGNCPAQAGAALDDMLARARAGDVLFLPALRLDRFSNQFAATNVAQARASLAGASAEAGRRKSERDLLGLLQPLIARGVHVVLEAPTPLLPAPPFRCADAFNRGNPICAPGLSLPRDDLERYRAPVLAALARLRAEQPAISIWDPFPELCPGTTCEAFRDGRPLYFDGDHVSGYANTLLLPSFERHLATLDARP